ncbi:mannonate dehydratase [Loktanella sp. F6476L]|uniref:mannonate dehydratase n=1 Tax=Loktanella sp. F6476L TaxID=2926405 RepID=UPI001FF16226|nr:mannonate dehydratase [Loktanella sp. F6476L]MCK0119578.1 mannonate dehydratase [Loktanella sp. F6476L]
MKQTWRWFGPHDTITTADMRQCGVQGVVSALHHIAPGKVWLQDEIKTRQAQISTFPNGTASGLAWDVVESLPVSETIKTKGPDYTSHIANYIESLRNIAACGISVVCYNFMPILDWTRTDLRRRMDHGGNAMSFNLIDFVAFDLHILKRATAADDYSAEILSQAAQRYSEIGADGALQLQNNIIAGLPGANDTWTLQQVRDNLATYAQIDAAKLYSNMIDFLAEVAPVAQDLGIRLCCHPDDPPFPLLGLPRIMSTQADYAKLIQDVDVAANGITFCSGSLGVDPNFDGPAFIRALGHRIHFVHLRNTTREKPNDGKRTSFHEAAHLEGDTDMVAVIQALVAEEAQRRETSRDDHEIPMRPDHGQDILDDLTKDSMPGYPLIGRMRGLAELRGIMAATLHAQR